MGRALLTPSRFIDKGYDVVTLVSSCALMLKQEWPNLLPNDEVWFSETR